MPARKRRFVPSVSVYRCAISCPFDRSTLQAGLALPGKDFEDNLQIIAAVDAGLDAVVTRNPSDFAACPLPVLTPQQLLAKLSSSSTAGIAMLPELTNMLSWWQWAILAAVPPAIVLLYFLKLKRRPLEVPSTYLWHKSVEDLHVNSIWQRLRNNLLLYLQLAVVLFIFLALLRPVGRPSACPAAGWCC